MPEKLHDAADQMIAEALFFESLETVQSGHINLPITVPDEWQNASMGKVFMEKVRPKKWHHILEAKASDGVAVSDLRNVATEQTGIKHHAGEGFDPVFPVQSTIVAAQ
ncbi:MAG: hypothetical protein A2792_00190 [Sphingomonadales bacterium RIFCSPHIGHO2_01_FULL_65_20]|nr:MAG: hypothetical protein A2792_00190 [Sphingomonadales bacterium RIFCSPHIGHO2_01_FULL_65_20]